MKSDVAYAGKYYAASGRERKYAFGNPEREQGL